MTLPSPRPALSRLRRPPEWLLLLGLALLALIPRLYQLTAAPPGLNGDEIYNAIDAMKIGAAQSTAERWPIFLPGNNGREALYFYLLAPFLRLLGETVLALRLPSALLGSGSALLAYLIGREAFNRRAGLVAGALIAVSLWPFMQSRIALRAVLLTFMSALTVFLFLRALAGRRTVYWLAAGASLGLTLYTYIPARVFPAVILAWLVTVALWQRARLRQQWLQVMLALGLALLVFAPFGWYIVRYPDQVNRRIHTLSSTWERARAGEPEALLESVGGVLKMFTVDGDDEWRYHVAERPVFDPLTGLFFYGGVALALWRGLGTGVDNEQRPAYLLLLFWLGAMLAPNAILEENPSFLRAAGAIVPTYLLAGIGFDMAYSWLRARWYFVRPLALPIFALLLVLTLAATWRAYFGRWVPNPEVRATYNADLAMMATYLEAHPPPPETRVYVAYGYVLDNPTAVAWRYYTEQPVSWFHRDHTFAWPDASNEEALYLIPARHNLPAPALALLQEAGTIQAIPYDDGALAFTLYQLQPDGITWASDETVSLTFINGPRLLGYELPETVYRGETVTVTTYLEVPASHISLPNALTFLEASLLDAEGNERAHGESLLGYPQSSWQPGDRFVQQFPLEVPTGMLPGPASLRFSLRDVAGHPYTQLELSQEAVAQLVVRSRLLDDFVPPPEMAVYDGTLALTDATLSTLLTPGVPVNLSLDWVALRPPAGDLRVQLQLAAPGAREPFLSQTYGLWPDRYPPSRWRTNEPVTTLHRLLVPLDIPTEVDPELRVQVLPPQGEGETPLPLTQGNPAIAQMTLSLRAHDFEPPPVANQVQAQFGPSIELLGYELDKRELRPGGEIQLTLVWQALETPVENYVVFNHLRGSDGRLWGQLDGPPQSEAWLTSTWLPGEVVVEERVIPVQPDAPPGSYQLVIGLYTPDDVIRLPVTVESEPQPADELLLGDLEVGE